MEWVPLENRPQNLQRTVVQAETEAHLCTGFSFGTVACRSGANLRGRGWQKTGTAGVQQTEKVMMDSVNH